MAHNHRDRGVLHSDCDSCQFLKRRVKDAGLGLVSRDGNHGYGPTTPTVTSTYVSTTEPPETKPLSPSIRYLQAHLRNSHKIVPLTSDYAELLRTHSGLHTAHVGYSDSPEHFVGPQDDEVSARGEIRGEEMGNQAKVEAEQAPQVKGDNFNQADGSLAGVAWGPAGSAWSTGEPFVPKVSDPSLHKAARARQRARNALLAALGGDRVAPAMQSQELANLRVRFWVKPPVVVAMAALEQDDLISLTGHGIACKQPQDRWDDNIGVPLAIGRALRTLGAAVERAALRADQEASR